MRNLVELTDSQIEEAFEDLGIGVSVTDVAFTRDTIADFIEAAKTYREYGTSEETENTLLIYNVQIRKGDTREDLHVIDFGQVRGSFK